MHVRIIETRDYCSPSTVNHPRCLTAPPKDLVIAADRGDFSVLQRNRVDKARNGIRRDFAANQYGVGMHMASGPSRCLRACGEKVLLMSCGSRRNRVFWKSSRRRSMYHRVCVLDADTVGTIMTLHDIHYGVIGVALGPVSLPLEHDGK